jgi:Fe-S-cluster containining protein
LEIVSQVMDLYARIDKAVAEFQLRSGLRCPSGCGLCCPTADVRVTVLEMLPMAREIFLNHDAGAWMDRLAAQPVAGRCILFSEEQIPSAGHCSFYTWRPVLCRLFGYAAVRSRTGANALSVCKYIRQNDPEAATAAMAYAGEAPCFIHYGSRVYALDPVLGNELMPINTALRRAIERLGLNYSLTDAAPKASRLFPAA